MKCTILTSFFLLAVVSCAAAQTSPAEKISNYRAQHREGRVVADGTLTRIAREQADAMAAKDVLDHSVLGDFNARAAPSGAANAAENIAYGNTTFDKTLDQWIKSPSHQKNLLLRGATRLGVASARSEKTGRTYWAMVIAGGYDKRPAPATTKSAPKAKDRQSKRASTKSCTLNILGLCL